MQRHEAATYFKHLKKHIEQTNVEINDLTTRIRMLRLEMNEPIDFSPIHFIKRHKAEASNIKHEKEILCLQEEIEGRQSEIENYQRKFLNSVGVAIGDASETAENASHRLANTSETLIDLVGLSLNIPENFREEIRHNPGCTADVFWKTTTRLQPDLPIDVIPSSSWGRRLASQSVTGGYEKRLPDSVVLLRTLDLPSDEGYRARMNFQVGDIITMGPGLSTSVVRPHWLGRDILLIIKGVEFGVPLVGKWEEVHGPNENEVFITQTHRYLVTNKEENAKYKNTGRTYKAIYTIQRSDDVTIARF